MKTIQITLTLTESQAAVLRTVFEDILSKISDDLSPVVKAVDVKKMFFRMNKTSVDFVNDLRTEFGRSSIPAQSDGLRDARVFHGIVNYQTIISTLCDRGGVEIEYDESASGKRRRIKSFRFTF
jgi:hypothetical protein